MVLTQPETDLQRCRARIGLAGQSFERRLQLQSLTRGARLRPLLHTKLAFADEELAFPSLDLVFASLNERFAV